MAMTTPEPDLLPFVDPGDIAPVSKERAWLVRGLWGRAAVGVLGGAPKTCKSWLALDLAVSVASATDCLGRLHVDDPGRALIYLAEDSPQMTRRRIESLCLHRHLDLQRLDLKVITAPVLRLDLADDQTRLAATVAALRPRLLLLDPLIRLHRLDENSSADISGLLGFLRELQRSHDLAVLLVHHTSKKHRSHPGLALRGSSDIHAFGDSNLYIECRTDHLGLTIEHRAAPAPEPLSLKLLSRPDGSATHLEVVSALDENQDEPKRSDIADQIIALLASATSPLQRSEIRGELRVNNQRLGQALTALEQRGAVVRSNHGWSIPTGSQSTASPKTHSSQLLLID